MPGKISVWVVNPETYYSFPNIHDENNVFRYSPGFVEVRTTKMIIYNKDSDLK